MSDKEVMNSEEKKKATENKLTFQRNAYQLTINNPQHFDFTHEIIKSILVTKFPTLLYFCMVDEISTTGTPHTHIYVYFSSRVRGQKIKKNFPPAHIEIAKGSVQANINYIKKEGSEKNKAKADTQVSGTFFEFGIAPTQRGKNTDLQDLMILIKEGLSTAEILETNNDYIKYLDKIDRIRTVLLIEQFQRTRRLDLEVTYVYGETGTGKTRGILDEFGDENVYRVSDYQHPFDGYNCQNVLVFDEFRSNLRLSDMLNYLDIYPIQLPARYSNKFLCATKIFIVSNWSLEDQYADLQRNDERSWKAFLRRIKKVKLYTSSDIMTYETVKEYFNRDHPFQPVSLTEDTQIEMLFDKNQPNRNEGD